MSCSIGTVKDFLFHPTRKKKSSLMIIVEGLQQYATTSINYIQKQGSRYHWTQIQFTTCLSTLTQNTKKDFDEGDVLM